MSRAEILNKLKEILSGKLRIVSNPDLIQESTDLIKDFNIDSMKIISLLVELENCFNIAVDSEEISQETLTNLSKLITFIEKDVGGRN